jgi:uncharacterized protein
MPENHDNPEIRPSRILDMHCHIASLDYIPRSFIDGAISNMVTALIAQGVPASANKLFGMFEQKMQDPLCDGLVQEMERAGIAKSVLLIADFTYALRDCKLSVQEAFENHRKVLERHPGKFEVFGGVDPRWGKDGIALFERSLAEYAFSGFKVYPPCGFSPSDRSLFPYYELCAAYGVPVLIHIGPTSPALGFNSSNPFGVDDAARSFPSVNFILAHGSVSFTEECIMMCRFRPNVYLDISAFQSTLAFDPEAKAVKHTVSQGINHKVIFGTDWPVFRLQGSQKDFVDTIISENGPLAELNERERSLVLYQNAERLLERKVAVAA